MSAHNPYQAPVVTDRFVSDSPVDTHPFTCWLRSWVGIGVSGMCFGLIGGPIGIIVGGLIAFSVGLVVTVLFFLPIVLMAREPVDYSRVKILGALCGFISGFLSMSLLSGDVTPFAIVPGIIGALGGVLGNVGRTGANTRKL